MFNQKSILIALAIFIILSFSYLAFSESRQHQIESGWFLYFNNPQDKSLDFTIENYSDKNEFQWELSVDGTVLRRETVQVLKETRKDVKIDEPQKGQEIKVKVYSTKESQEIYKNFEQ